MKNNIQPIENPDALNEVHIERIKDMTKGMSKEDYSSLVQTITSEVLLAEIERRNNEVDKILKAVKDCIATKLTNDMKLVDKQMLILELKKLLKGDFENGKQEHSNKES